ncbi:ribosomal protein S9/S16-domain-containing protein [Phycomyces nitens]|nr:ribosomal protein S9/S16-domain-containing protein [Phycomyces nitens]
MRASTLQANTSTTDDILAYREKPTSLSYFTGNFKYNDLLIELDLLHKKYADWKSDAPKVQVVVENASLPSDLATPKNGVTIEVIEDLEEPAARAWKLREKMSEMLGIPLKTSQWRKIVGQLNQLASLPAPLPSAVELVLQQYSRFDATQQQTAKPKTLDDLGRAYAAGRRKESSARCWVVEGEGKVLVNGESLETYFKRPVDRDEVTLPLKVTENSDKFNVWVSVNGGGTTGQAQAIKLGVGKALLTHNMEWKPLLREAGCITRDPRVVERKKEGQRKARARYTWYVLFELVEH